MKLLEKTKNKIARNFFIDFSDDYRDSILLAGSGRSGTTWVSDIINYDNEYRYIFEPFHPRRVDFSKEFGHRKYIHPEKKDTKLREKFKYILNGGLRSSWSDYYNKKIFANKRLIKEIRINLCLKWIKNNFHKIPIVLLIRNPFPTSISKDKFNLHTDLNDYLIQEDLMNDHLKNFRHDIIKAKEASEFERNMFIWCIENYIPLKQLKKDEILVTFYENFCTKPEGEIKKTFNFIGKDFNESVLKTLNKPSAVSKNWSAINTGEDLTNSWKKKVTEDQIKRGKEILALFGMDNFYNDDSTPSIESIERFMG
jgi:hypothetical protein